MSDLAELHRWVSTTRSSIALILVLLLGVGCAPMDQENSSQANAKSDLAEGEAPAQDKVVLVETVQLRTGRVEDTITLSGDLEAENRVDLTSQISGIVLSVNAKEGASVGAGDVLLALDDAELELSVREKELAHRDAEARARSTSIEKQEAEQIEAVRLLAFEKAERELVRLEKIVVAASRSPLSEEEVDAKRYARDEAKLNLESAKLATQRVSVAAELTTIAVDQAEAAWDRAKLELSRAEIRAPFDGVVSYLELRTGELVQVGTRVAEVVSPIELYTEVRVPQRRMGALAPGQPVSLVAETLPDRAFAGRVDAIHPTVDPTQGTVKVRVRVDDPDGVLRPGAFVSATIVLTSRDEALLVPKRCRLFEGEDSIVYVVRDDQAVRVPLQLGLQTAESLEVLPTEDGLRLDDQVIIRGQTHVRSGTKVRVEEPADETPAEEPTTAAQARSVDSTRG